MSTIDEADKHQIRRYYERSKRDVNYNAGFKEAFAEIERAIEESNKYDSPCGSYLSDFKDGRASLRAELMKVIEELRK